MKVLNYIIISALCVGPLNGLAQTLLINEFQARNAFTITDDHNEYEDWIEIANVSDQEIDLNGYYITDDLGMKSKFRLSSSGNSLSIPSGGYLVLWADHEEFQGDLHLGFKIADTGDIALFSPSLQFIDSIRYSAQHMDISMGRIPVFPYEWRFFQQVTPGKENTTQFFAGIIEPPIINNKSGIYKESVMITISPSYTSDSVYYTTDNTTPTSKSLLYKNPLLVASTKVINFIGTRSSYINSDLNSEVFIIHPAFTLPVVTLITDSVNLYGPIGIFTDYNTPWEKFCQIRYLSNGVLTAKSNAGIRIQGASSVFMPKKSFRLFFRSSYGDGKFQYSVFGPNRIESFDKLVLKSGYDDDLTMERGTLLRDALAAELWKKTGGLPQLSRWVILYMNNKYWGIYNLRESIDENYIREHTGMVDFDLVRFRNEGPDPVFGSLENWNGMFELATNGDLSKVDNYQALKDRIDMDNFINLMAFVQLTGYYSWPWGISMYSENSILGRWRVSIWDADRAFTDADWDGFREAMEITGNYYWANRIPRNLMKNSEFKQKYANRLQELMQTVFWPDNSVAILDSIYNIIAPEIEGELERWAPDNHNWEANVESLREFLRLRPAVVSNLMQDYLPSTSGSGNYTVEKERLLVYPNPFTSQLLIQIYPSDNKKINVTIRDSKGLLIKELFSGSTKGEELRLTWNGSKSDGSGVSPGLYIISVITLNEIYHTKVIAR